MIDFSWRVGGEAGYGIVTAGNLFARMCMRHGLNVYGSREYPSLIRGGHNTFTIRFSDKELNSQSQYCDLIAALNERTISEELKDLKSDGLIIHDSSINPIVKKAKLMPVPLKEIASKYGNAKLMMNTVIIGVSAGLIGLNKSKCLNVIKRVFKKKGDKVIKPNIKAFSDGYALGSKNQLLRVPNRNPLPKMLVNGNTAFAIGSVRAGCNFISAYPMTPATGIYEYLCKQSKGYGIRAVQTEDEIASLNNALGASFTGARAMTCTSGGGFALMNEALSLAGMTETPVVIAVSQRPGPATGLPTRTSQGDLLFVLNAGHGEFSKIVMAPGDVNECYEMALESFNYADVYQTPVIVLLDKHLSVSVKTVKPFKDNYKINRGLLVTKTKRIEEGHRFKRYEFTKNGVSPRPLPAIKGLTYCFAGDEHDEEGFIIEDAVKAVKISNKRLRKERLIEKQLRNKIQVYGRGDLTIISWGSTKGAILTAQELLRSEGIRTRFIQVRVLKPLPLKEIKSKIKGTPVIIEDNRDGQLASLLGVKCKKINKYDGRPINPEEIVREVKRLL